jgi:hypothetical protein
MDLFDTLTFAEILGRTTFLGTLSLTVLRYKILRLVVEKHHFILIIGAHVNKYEFEAQYSPKQP